MLFKILFSLIILWLVWKICAAMAPIVLGGVVIYLVYSFLKELFL